MQEFNYQQMWELEQPAQRPHKKRADELGIKVTDIPVSPALTKLGNSIRRLNELYNAVELEEEGVYVEELLNHFTEAQALEFLEENGFEQSVSLGEIEGLMFGSEWDSIMQIPRIMEDYFMLKQLEEGPSGKMVDTSVFNTVDFDRHFSFEFDKYKYFTDKVAEKAEDLAIMHSCLSTEEGRSMIKDRYIALVNGKFRNYAMRLTAMIKASQDKERRSELLDKLREQNRQIRRLRAIWHSLAYSL